MHGHSRRRPASTLAGCVRFILVIVLCALLLTRTTHAQLPPAVAIVGVLPSYDITTRAGINEPPSPPAAEFLGSGYDATRGNPSETEAGAWLDPGFRQSVVVLVYDIRRAAGGYQVPFGTELKILPSCNHATLAQEVDSIGAYQDFLALDVLVQTHDAANVTALIKVAALLNMSLPSILPATGFVPASSIAGFGSTSVSLLAQKTLIEEMDMISFYSRALCAEYEMEFRSYVEPLLTDNFLNGVSTLPDAWPAVTDTSFIAAIARAKFMAFISEFGTHYVSRLVAGGKRVVSVSIKRTAVEQLKAVGVNIPLGAAFDSSLLPFIDASFTISAQKLAFDAISASIVSRREATLGGSPFVTWEEWARSIPGSNRAIPLQYSLKPLWLLLAGAKQIALRQAIDAYIDAAAQRVHN